MKKNLQTLFLLLLAIIAGLVLLSNLLANKIISDKLRKLDVDNFQILFQDIETQIFSRSIKLTEVLIQQTNSEEQIKVEELQISGIKLLSLFVKSNFLIEKISASGAELIAISPLKLPHFKNSNTSVVIKNLEIIQAKILIYPPSGSNNDTLFFSHLNFTGKDLYAGTAKKRQADKSRMFNHFQAAFSNTVYFFPNKLYRLQLHELKYNSENQVANLDSGRITTLFSKYELGQKTGVETDWFNISFGGLDIDKFNLNLFLNKKGPATGNVFLKNFNAKIFRDKHLPFPEKKATKLPGQLLENIPFPVHCDSLLIVTANIEYSERPENSDLESSVSFQQLQATIYNISNTDSLISGLTRIKTSAKVMNQSLLQAEFEIPNKKFQGKHKVTGSLHPINIAAFNPVITPNAFVRVENGKINTFEFNFEYNNLRSRGTLNFEYENLKLLFLNQEDGSNKVLKSIIANSFLVKKENQKNNKTYTLGEISFERDRKKSIFNYWWKSILSGIESISII